MRTHDVALIVFAGVELILVMLIWLRTEAHETREPRAISRRNAAYGAALRRHRFGSVSPT